MNTIRPLARSTARVDSRAAETAAVNEVRLLSRAREANGAQRMKLLRLAEAESASTPLLSQSVGNMALRKSLRYGSTHLDAAGQVALELGRVVEFGMVDLELRRDVLIRERLLRADAEEIATMPIRVARSANGQRRVPAPATSVNPALNSPMPQVT